MANEARLNFLIVAKDAATKAIKGVNRAIGGLRSGASAVGNAFVKVGAVAATAFGAIAGAATYAVKQASDFNETLNKTKVVLGDASDEVVAFAAKASDSLGLSQTDALNAASTFAIFGKSAKLSGSDLAGFSTDLTTLAADFGSFYNASNEDAITAIGAALRGESEPIRRFGVLLNEATLKDRALRMGLIKTTKQALTPQQRVLAAQAEIMEQAQATGAAGDFGRTLGGSLPNQLKVLQATFDNLTTSLGQEFLPIAFDLVSWANKDIVPAIKAILPQVTAFAKSAFSTAGTIGTKLIPVIQAVAGWVGKNLIPKFQQVAQTLFGPGGVAESVMGVVGPIIQNLLPVFQRVFDAVSALIGKVGELVGWLWGDGNGPLAIAVQAIGAAFGVVGNIIAVVADAIGVLIDLVMAVGKAIADSPIGQLVGFLGDVGSNLFGGGSQPVPVAATSGSSGSRGIAVPAPQVTTNVTLDGRQIAQSVDTRIGRTATATNNNRGR